MGHFAFQSVLRHLKHLQQEILPESEPEKAHASAHGGKAVRVRSMW